MVKQDEEKPLFEKGWFWALVIVALVIVGLVLWVIGTYNSLVTLNQQVNTQWAQVQSQYQRRYDLIPNLVNSVKGYMQFEQTTLENVTAARSQWGAAKDSGDLNAQVAASTGLDNAIARLLVVMENYPVLKSDTLVQGLMDELAGTENRIAVERMRYNDVVRQYDTTIQMFPGNIIANQFGFTVKPYYEATEGAQTAPLVNLTTT